LKDFRVFDSGADGALDKKALFALLQGLGDKFTEEYVHELVKEADADGDGLIDVNEFLAWATRIPTVPHHHHAALTMGPGESKRSQS